MGSRGKGLPFIGKMNQFIEKVLHPTVQKVGNSKAALDVTARVYYIVNGSSTPLTVEADSTDNLLNCTGLNAIPGDIIRFLTTANDIKEIEITVDAAPDADSATLAGFLSDELTAGDTFHLLRAVSEIANPDGSSLATVISPPIQYNIKSAGVTTATTVLDDQDTPSATKAIPVSIRDVNGATITINAGDLTISVDHTNDSIKIGDGTRLAGVTASNELKTSDAVLAAKDFATQTTLAALLTELQAKADPSETQTVEELDAIASGTISTQNLSLTGTATANSAVEVDTQGKSVLTIQTVGTYTGILGVQVTNDDVVWATTTQSIIKRHSTGSFGAGVLNSGAQDVYKINIAGFKKARVSMTNAMTGSVVATLVASKGEDMISSPVLENTLTDMSAKLPSSVGTKTSALSLSVVLASDQATVPVSGPLTDAQLRATAVPVSGTVTSNIGTTGGLALDTNIDALRVLTGAVNEAAPASDTASSGLNGRLQRIAQRITSLIAVFPAALGAQTSANSFSIVPASDATFTVKPKALTNSYDEYLTLTTVETFTAPANAIGGKIMASDANGANVRYKQNGTATTTSGMQLQPARAEDFTGGSNITVVSESGTNAVYIQWTIQS